MLVIKNSKNLLFKFIFINYLLKNRDFEKVQKKNKEAKLKKIVYYTIQYYV